MTTATLPHLSPAQARILDALLKGKSQKEIASSFTCNIKTIEFHIARIRDRLEDQGLALTRSYTITHKGE